jgi:hypothetical protein
MTVNASRGVQRLVVLCALAAVLVLAEVALFARELPSRLTGAEFRALIDQTSEPNGYFRSDNLVSDERIFAEVVPAMMARPRRASGVYVGVGPEQNFTYIAALQSPMAFILDIRRGNLHLQLLYKALFELSADRADFISRLFVKPRPAGLTPSATAGDLMRAYWTVKTSDRAVFEQRVAEVNRLLVDRHGGSLDADDLRGIEYVYYNFYWRGPSITWASSAAGGQRPAGYPTFADLANQEDADGRELSYLATEARFAFVKDLQARNLIVPVVGNFAGPKALRAIGEYVRGRGATVDAFYVSEVEAYLATDGLWPAFCGNLATLPVNDRSVLVRPSLAQFGWPGPTIGVTQGLFDAFHAKESRLVPIQPEVASCRRTGGRVGRGR